MQFITVTFLLAVSHLHKYIYKYLDIEFHCCRSYTLSWSDLFHCVLKKGASIIEQNKMLILYECFLVI